MEHRLQRENRRRRVLRDDLGPAAQRPRESVALVDSSNTSYVDDALDDCQLRVFDVLPQTAWSLVSVFTLGLGSIVGLGICHSYRLQWDWFQPTDVASLDIGSGQSIATWLASLTLFLAGVICLMIFVIRRHKIDDYGGRYGLWLWSAAGCVIASVDATAGVHRLVQSTLMRLTGLALHGDGSLWWMLCVVLFGGYLAIRAFVDMRPSVLARSFLLLSALSYMGASVFHLELTRTSLPFRQIDIGLASELIENAALLVGHFFLLYSLLLYARAVFLEAQRMGAAGERDIAASKRMAASGHRRLFSRWRRKARQDRDVKTDESPSREKKRSKKLTQSRPKQNPAQGEPQPIPTEPKTSAKQSPHASEGAEVTNTLKSTDANRNSLQDKLLDLEPDQIEKLLAGGSDQKISKAERRRLRKQLRKQRRAA